MAAPVVGGFRRQVEPKATAKCPKVQVWIAYALPLHRQSVFLASSGRGDDAGRQWEPETKSCCSPRDFAFTV